MNACYPEAIYRRLADMELSDPTFQQFEAHVQTCEKCQINLQEMLNGENELGPNSTNAHTSFPDVPGFQIEARLGIGGMGVVYLAWQLELQRYVAIKLVSHGPAPDGGTRKRWLNEARSLSRVVHPQVVQIHQVGESIAGLFLVMEYVAGGSLKERLLAGPLPPREAAELIEKLARAVHFLHQHKIWHLDIKPSNILMAGPPGAPIAEAVAKLSDFGIAYIDGQSGATLTVLAGPRGTPPYMAPEQVLSRPETLGSWTDTYGLGATLYHLLCGKPPYEAESTVELLDQIRDATPVRPRRLNGRIPRDLETICLKCLEKDPDRRYVSAEALAEDLRRWLSHQPIKARPISFFGHARGWCRRYPVVAGLLALLAITIFGSFVVLVGALRDVQSRHQIATDAMSDFSDIASHGSGLWKSVKDDPVDHTLFRVRTHFRRLYDVNDQDRVVRDQLVKTNLTLASRFLGRNESEKALELLTECEHLLAVPSIQGGADNTKSNLLAITHRDLAAAARNQGQFAEAIRHYETALVHLSFKNGLELPFQSKMQIIECHLGLGYVKCQMGKSSEARIHYEEASRLLERVTREEASDRNVIALRVNTFMCLGDLETAYKILSGHMESDPGFPNESACLADKLINSAQRLMPDEALIAQRRSLTLLLGAIPRIEALVFEDPGNGSYGMVHERVYVLLGQVLIALGKKDRVLTELRHFLQVRKSLHNRREIQSKLDGEQLKEIAILAGMTATLDTSKPSPGRLRDRWDLARSLAVEIDPMFASRAVLGYSFISYESRGAVEYRRTNRLAEALKLVAEQNELTDSLVRDFPNDAYSYLARAEAQHQVVKNLWKTAGPREVKPAMLVAIQSARHALELDPKNELARAQMIELTRRYDGIEVPAE